MTDAPAFRRSLADKLACWSQRVLLRIALGPDSPPVELTGAALAARARALAQSYTAGTPENSVVLILLPHSVELFLLHFGLILENRIPAIIAWPTSRVDAEKYQRNLLHQLANLPASKLITLPRLAANLGPGLPYATDSCEIAGAEAHEKHFAGRLHLEGASAPPAPRAAGDPGPAVFLQFSGGTTGAQKCVVVTAGMMDAQMRRLAETLAFTEEDGVVSWLPLYHDMGLIACLWFPLWHGAPSLHMGASDWLLNPGRLFADLDRFRATFTWLPNFAFSYMAGARERMGAGACHQLGHVRGFINCSEPVRLKSMNTFAETFAEWGVRVDQCQASYAMAENVFAVTQTPLGEPAATCSRAQLRGSFAPVSFGLVDDVYVSSGRLLEGMEMRVGALDAPECGPGEPGEIFIRTECLFDGYWGAEGFTRNALSADGWYSTGDYGFVSEGELFVIGRLKDIMIVGGQNVFPEDVEAVVNTVDGIYPGRVVSFGLADDVNGTEAIAIVAELRGDFEPARAADAERQIRRQVLATIGIAPRWVRVVPERWIVKSTAGKISRRDTRRKFEQERLTPA